MKHFIIYCLFIFLPIISSGQDIEINTLPKAKQLIDEIVAQVKTEPLRETVDLIVAGNPETPVKGIVSCMFATMEVLKKAVAIDANLIITHEPTFYNHFDEVESFQNDKVYKEKIKYIRDNNLVVWRFHDYAHRIENDAILIGMVQKLGWKKNQEMEGVGRFSFPERTLNDLLKHLKNTFQGNSFYVVGNPEMSVSKVALAPGAPGSMQHISLLRDPNIDVVIGGEVSQWETYEYVRDAVFQKKKKAIVFIGHINSEESGMAYVAEWLQKFVTNIPITYIASGSSYWSY